MSLPPDAPKAAEPLQRSKTEAEPLGELGRLTLSHPAWALPKYEERISILTCGHLTAIETVRNSSPLLSAQQPSNHLTSTQDRVLCSEEQC